MPQQNLLNIHIHIHFSHKAHHNILELRNTRQHLSVIVRGHFISKNQQLKQENDKKNLVLKRPLKK